MRIVRAFRRLPSSAPSRPSLGGVRRTLTRRPVPASRAERPLGDRTGNRGRNAGQTGKMRRKTDARQVGAGLIIATHQPDQLLGPEGPRSQAHFVDRGRNEPGHTETNVYRSSCGGSQKRGATMANVRGSCLCGGVKFEIIGPLMRALNCHCSKCRKQHGAAFRRLRLADHQQIEPPRVWCPAGHTRRRPERAADAPLLCRKQSAVVRHHRYSSSISGATRLLLKTAGDRCGRADQRLDWVPGAALGLSFALSIRRSITGRIIGAGGNVPTLGPLERRSKRWRDCSQ
jgi:hypothetical protein